MNTKAYNPVGMSNSDLYESPEMTLVEINPEGVLCASGEYEDEYEEEFFPWI